MFKAANNDNISRPNSRPKLPFPGNGKGNLKLGREGKFEACIPGNHGKREFPLTPDVLVDFFGVILKGGSKHFHRKQNLALLCTILCGKTTFQPIAPH